MTNEKLYEVLGDINEKHVKEAREYRKAKKPVWLKWGAMAACLCLVLGLAIPMLMNSNPAGGPTPGGSLGDLSDNIDPIMASIAVYPATEELQNVKSATMDSLDKETAYSFEVLGKYLPAVLPEGYQFDKASLYETIMANGTKYYQLRVTYSDNITEEPSTTVDQETGETVQNAPTATGNSFTVFIMNYQPNTEKTIYSGDALIEYVKELPSNGVFHFYYDNLYFGFVPLSLSADEVLTVINSINP